MGGEDCEQNLCNTPITDHHFRIVEEKEEENKTKSVTKLNKKIKPKNMKERTTKRQWPKRGFELNYKVYRYADTIVLH